MAHEEPRPPGLRCTCGVCAFWRWKSSTHGAYPCQAGDNLAITDTACGRAVVTVLQAGSRKRRWPAWSARSRACGRRSATPPPSNASAIPPPEPWALPTDSPSSIASLQHDPSMNALAVLVTAAPSVVALTKTAVPVAPVYSTSYAARKYSSVDYDV